MTNPLLAWMRTRLWNAKSRVPANLRIRIRTALFRTPRLARFIGLFDLRTRANLATPDTGIVIDGLHRSANTYAVISFRQANPTVTTSSHLHSPQSLHEARRYSLPMILLIRDPKEVIPSYLQLEPGASPAAALAMYIGYYTAVLPHLDEVVVADFRETIADFASVVRRCNEKFGTHFNLPERTPDFEASVKDTIRRDWDGLRAMPLPSATRRTAPEILATFDEPTLETLAVAERLYAQILEASGRPGQGQRTV